MWIGITLAVLKGVGKLSVVIKRLSKLAGWSEISFLSGFNTSVGILYGPVVLLISRDERISLVSSIGKGKK